MPARPIAANLASVLYLEIDGQAYALAGCALPQLSWPENAPPPGGAGGRPARGAATLGEVAIRFAPALMPPLAGWVDDFAAGRATVVELGVLRADADGRGQERLLLRHCVLTELRFPECDGAGKEVYLVEAVFQPQAIGAGPGGGTVKSPVSGRQKKWLGSNFRLVMADLPTARVRRVAGFTLARGPRLPGATRCSALTVSVGGADYPIWRDAAFKQLANGGVGAVNEASLELRDVSMKNVLATFGFRLAGFSAFRFDAFAPSDGLQLATASFAVDALSLKIE